MGRRVGLDCVGEMGVEEQRLGSDFRPQVSYGNRSDHRTETYVLCGKHRKANDHCQIHFDDVSTTATYSLDNTGVPVRIPSECKMAKPN
jgi:hypothetical protein